MSDVDIARRPHGLLPALAAALLCVAASRPAGAAGLLEPTLLEPRSYAESFTFVADLDDGTYVQAQLAITNVGLTSGRGACRAVVVAPGRDPWRAARVVDRDDWRYDAAPSPVLAVGPCRATATADALSIEARLEDGSVAVTLRRAARRVAPPDHEVRTSSGFYDVELLVPWAAAEVTLAVPGAPARVASGRGYADHSRSTTMPGDLARGWVRFRALGGDCPALLLLRLPPGGGPARGWLWQGDTEADPRPIEGRVALPDPDRPGSSFDLGIGELALRLWPRALLVRSAPAEEFGVLGRLVSAWIGLDVTTTHRTTIEGLPGCGRTDGILELSAIR